MPTDIGKPFLAEVRNLENLNELPNDPGFNPRDPAGADANDAGGSGHAASGTLDDFDEKPKPDDAVIAIRDFVFFGDGERLASLKLHYLTLGDPNRDAKDAMTNPVQRAVAGLRLCRTCSRRHALGNPVPASVSLSPLIKIQSSLRC